MSEHEIFRIGNAGGYWGDDPQALRRQILGPLALDCVAIDYLAEVTMSILQKQKGKDPAAGYARDFITQAAPLLPEILARGIRIVTNAGGVNPMACAEALAEAARAQGLVLRIAVVEGDDVAARIPELLAAGAHLANLDTGAPFLPMTDRVLSANAYFGAMPVAEALKHEPHVVICGRVTDTGLTLGPLIHRFGWGPEDWDQLAAGIVAGHLLECGAQATGGNFTDWGKVPSYLDLGFPIAECRADGSFTLTKHPGSGGLVSCQTAREQLLYEMGHPQSYLTPDVIADFSGIQLEADGPDRVRVTGVRGRPPTELLKLSIAVRQGWKISGSLIISGPDAQAKAELFADVFWRRCASALAQDGVPALEATCTERVGDDSCHRGLTPDLPATEILLRLSAHAAGRGSLEVFRKLLPSMILSGPAGVAVTGGAPAASEVVGYWPALMPRALALPRVRVLEERGGGRLEPVSASGPLPWPKVPATAAEAPGPLDDPWPPFPDQGPALRLPLMRVAHARSGDKGDTANIGLIGRSPECYAWLRDHLTAREVGAWFQDHCRGRVERHRVPGLWALNFLLEETLGGGGTVSLALDAQGKTLAQALLRCQVEVPEALLATIAPGNRPCPGELVDDSGDEQP
jgi:hypothetical protein